MEKESLLVVAWTIDQNKVRLVPCLSQQDALDELTAMVHHAPYDLRVVAFVAMQGAALFAEKHQEASLRHQWCSLTIGMKQSLLDDGEDLRPALKQNIPSSIAPFLRWPELSLTLTERRQLNVEAGRLPRFIQDASMYVLWGIKQVQDQNKLCASRDLVQHPANKGLYSKRTIFNTITGLKKNGFIAEGQIGHASVFSLTALGKESLEEAEQSYDALHQRKSVRSLYGTLLS